MYLRKVVGPIHRVVQEVKAEAEAVVHLQKVAAALAVVLEANLKVGLEAIPEVTQGVNPRIYDLKVHQNEIYEKRY